MGDTDLCNSDHSDVFEKTCASKMSSKKWNTTSRVKESGDRFGPIDSSIRWRVMNMLAEGKHTKKAIAERYEIDVSTITAWEKKAEKQGVRFGPDNRPTGIPVPEKMGVGAKAGWTERRCSFLQDMRLQTPRTRWKN